MTAITMTASTFDAIASLEADNAARKETDDAAKSAISERKMEAYSALVCDLLDAPMQKGNLTTGALTPFREALMAAGFVNSKGTGVNATGKRYIDNTTGILRKVRAKKLSIPSQATPEAIREALADENIDSESDIVKWVNEGKEKYLHEHEAILKQVAGTWTFGKDNKGNHIPTGHKLAKMDSVDGKPTVDQLREQWLDIQNAVEARLDALSALESAASDANTDEKALAAMLKEIVG